MKYFSRISATINTINLLFEHNFQFQKESAMLKFLAKNLCPVPFPHILLTLEV